MKLAHPRFSISWIMKVLLRNEITGSFVGKETAWVENVQGAAEFKTLEAAVKKTLEYMREDVVVVLRDEDPKYGLALSGRIR